MSPALPPVPAVVKIIHTGTVATEPWAGISHWRYVTASGPLTNGQLEVICAKFVNSWRDNVAPLMSTGTVDIQVEGIDLTSSTAAVAVAADGNTGTDASPVRQASTCALVSKHVARRYRGGHPRTYWAGPPVDQTDATQWSVPHFSDAVVPGFMAYYADIPPAVTTDGDTNCTSWHEVQVSYVEAHARLAVPVVDDIIGYTVQQALATQRRRLHRTG